MWQLIFQIIEIILFMYSLYIYASCTCIRFLIGCLVKSGEKEYRWACKLLLIHYETQSKHSYSCSWYSSNSVEDQVLLFKGIYVNEKKLTTSL